jgi:hypothetical protein
MDKKVNLHSTADALQEWRAAEQVVAVARRGKLAAEAASVAAGKAVEAATATAEAAKASLAAASLAESSATRTAEAAKAIVAETKIDSADADSAAALAVVDEALAHQRYKDAVEQAKGRNRPA